MINFDGVNVSECLKYDLLTFCEFIFGGPTGGPNGGLRSQVSGLRSQVSGLRSQVSGLRSRVYRLIFFVFVPPSPFPLVFLLKPFI